MYVCKLHISKTDQIYVYVWMNTAWYLSHLRTKTNNAILLWVDLIKEVKKCFIWLSYSNEYRQKIKTSSTYMRYPHPQPRVCTPLSILASDSTISWAPSSYRFPFPTSPRLTNSSVLERLFPERPCRALLTLSHSSCLPDLSLAQVPMGPEETMWPRGDLPYLGRTVWFSPFLWMEIWGIYVGMAIKGVGQW